MENKIESLTTNKKIKCVVWDLDNTVWDGVLIEDKNVKLKDGIIEIIKTLDERGILQSIASKNDYDLTMEKLDEFGIKEYFLYPKISWNSKSSSIKNIAESINIGLETIAFIDDQPFELDEVKYEMPSVMCILAERLNNILDMPELNPKFITSDSKLRRHMYMSDIKRNEAEESFEGPKEDFLATLGMKFQISTVKENDLQRVEELTIRTHQLNATGYTYSYEELSTFINSPNHKLFIASLTDKYGTYGKIGLTLVECNNNEWTLKLLLMSCRVMSRGVGTVLLNHILNLAKINNVSLKAEFVPTDRNRVMYITYKFAGFKEIETRENIIILKNDLNNIQPLPDYIHLSVVK